MLKIRIDMQGPSWCSGKYAWCLELEFSMNEVIVAVVRSALRYSFIFCAYFMRMDSIQNLGYARAL